MTEAPGRFWVVRHPTSGGSIVAKFDTLGGSEVPPELAEYEDFIVQSVSNRGALTGVDIDQSGLTESEVDRITTAYPDVR